MFHLSLIFHLQMIVLFFEAADDGARMIQNTPKTYEDIL